MNVFEEIIVLLMIVLFWLFISALIMGDIRYQAKKKWHKNEKKYPYFHYPFYKKLFLLGLKGALSKVVVVMRFLLNITVILITVLTVLYLALPLLIISYILRALYGAFLVFWFLDVGFYLGFSINF